MIKKEKRDGKNSEKRIEREEMGEEKEKRKRINDKEGKRSDEDRKGKKEEISKWENTKIMN